MRTIAAVLGALLALTSMSVRADELQVTVASGALSGLASLKAAPLFEAYLSSRLPSAKQ